jgi:hypothetical protein
MLAEALWHMPGRVAVATEMLRDRPAERRFPRSHHPLHDDEARITHGPPLRWHQLTAKCDPPGGWRLVDDVDLIRWPAADLGDNGRQGRDLHSQSLGRR